MEKGNLSYTPVPKIFTAINATLIIVIITLNIRFQAFCIPTPWAAVLLTITFINTIIYPLTSGNKILNSLAGFINGVSFFVFLYCIIFLEQMHVWGILLSIPVLGGLVFIPHFFAVQLIWTHLIFPASRKARIFFLIPFPVCIAIIIFIGQLYSKAIESVGKFEKSGFEKLDKNFMTEKILGMHIIYHTRFCEYDGWRPPKHEPILVIGMWLNGRVDPLNVSLEKRLELYRKFFPENPYKFDCSCGLEYREDYFNDKLWKSQAGQVRRE